LISKLNPTNPINERPPRVRTVPVATDKGLLRENSLQGVQGAVAPRREVASQNLDEDARVLPETH